MTDEKNTVVVTTSIGDFTIVKPKAGVRNKAMMASETEAGKIKETKLMYLLLPKCIQKRPENIDDTVPIDQILDDLSTEDYDTLAIGLGSLIAGKKGANEAGAAEKKTAIPSK